MTAWPAESAIAPAERFEHVIEAHVANEAEHVAEYRAFAAQAKDPLVATLLSLVVEDEERHHALMRRMALRLRDDIEMTRSLDALEVFPMGRGGTAGLAERSRAYADDERQGAKVLRDLAREAGHMYGGAFALLLETMARDSEKHELVMRFIVRRLADED